MLIKFKFKNFRSFFSESLLSLEASKKQDLEYSVLDYNGKRILPIAVIYGGNASGKTTIILANLVLKSLILSGNITPYNNDSNLKNIGISSYLYNKDKYEVPIELGITFTENINDEKVLIEYNISLKNNFENMENTEIVYESLHINNELLFKKNKKEIIFGQGKKVSKYYLDYIDNNSVEKALNVYSELYKLNNDTKSVFTSWYKPYNSRLVDIITKWFKEKYFVMYNFNESQMDYVLNKNIDYKDISIIEDRRFDLLKNIIEIGKQKIVLNKDENSNKLNVKSVYKIENGNKYKELLINSDITESTGTLKMYKFLEPFINVLSNGGVMIIDELDASIHPELMLGIIKVFRDKTINANNAQLIFNTHNPIFLNGNVFRRDEIYFVEKNKEDYTSELYSLNDFINVRNDKSYLKDYLNGVYGALPDCDMTNVIKNILKRRG